MSQSGRIEVAVVGGGIVGLALALGLAHHNIGFQLYEQGTSLKEIGAGIGLGPNAVRALHRLDPRCEDAFMRVRTRVNEDEQYMRIVDGYAAQGSGDRDIPILTTIDGQMASCHRARFLEELVKLAPPEMIHYGKHIEDIEDRGDELPLRLHFADGSVAEADAGKSRSPTTGRHDYIIGT